jgi:hypothetical protein
MNCRTFHRNLEDYLQDGLDFANRFAIERHSRQCISCGKDLADAIELRHRVLDLKQVKAPADFESSLLEKIGMHKARSRSSAIRKFWIYSPEWLSWKKLMIASSSLAVLAIGILVLFQPTDTNPPEPTPVAVRLPEKALEPSPAVVHRPEKVAGKETSVFNTKSASPPPPSHAEVSAPETMPMPIARKTPKASPVSTLQLKEWMPFEESSETVPDYFRVLIGGSDVHPAPVPMLPQTIWIQYRPAPEEYFIQNVSH